MPSALAAGATNKRQNSSPRELPLSPRERRFPRTARTAAGGWQAAPADPSTLAKELARSVYVMAFGELSHPAAGAFRRVRASVVERASFACALLGCGR
jgi:hypothetical protein